MEIRLGINTGFAANRYPEPEQWIRIVGEYLELRTVQFTADLLNPSLPDYIINNQIAQILSSLKKYNVNIEHTFTSAFTRVNHLAHPDDIIREYWLNWFKRFAKISKRLGAISMGSHLGIYSVNDLKNRREFIFEKIVAGWKDISDYSKRIGLKYLTWEPMSIKRELGESIKETERIHRILNDNLPLPMKLCLDVDHGDVKSKNIQDRDPYAWLRKFGSQAPIIHIKQSLKDKGGHWPFTPKYNKDGIISPKKIIKAIEESGAEEVLLLLEISFREREPFESSVLRDLKASVEHWREYIK